MNKVSIDIDNDMADEIVVASLKFHIDLLKKDIKRVKSIKKPMAHNLADLEDFTKNLNAIKIVYEYYGGNLK